MFRAKQRVREGEREGGGVVGGRDGIGDGFKIEKYKECYVYRIVNDLIA